MTAPKYYNVVYNGFTLNKVPLNLRDAEKMQSSCIINYGYSPEIICIGE